MRVWGFVIPVVGMLEVEIRLVRQGEGSRIKMVDGLPMDQNKGWPTSHPIFHFLCTLYTTSAPKGSTVTMSLVPPNLELV